MFPAMAPPRDRAANSIHRLSAIPSQMYDTVAPARLINRTGLRPMRSLNPPHSGAERNWVKE